MRISELMEIAGSGMTRSPKDFKNLTKLGGFGFKRGITDKEKLKTPHYIMDKCLTMAQDNPIITGALEELINFIFPGKRINFDSSNKKTKKWLTKWMEQRPELNDEIYRTLWTNVATGNAGLQLTETKNGMLDNVYCLNDISRIYYNPDHETEEDEYVYALPLTVREFKFNGKIAYPTFHSIKYIAGDAFIVKQVYGIDVSSKVLKRYKTGWSRDGFYGRSILASSIDADNIMSEILSSWDTISKLKQIDQKIITPKGNSIYEISNPQYKDIQHMLEDGRGSYTFIPFPIEFSQQDIRTSNGYDTMTEVMEFLRRMLMMGLLPQHLTPWGESSTTMGSESSLPPFLARVRSKQEEFIKMLNNTILKRLRKDVPWLATDATFVFDAPEVMGETYYIDIITGLKREGILSKQQSIKWLSHIGVIRDDILNMKENEVKIVDPFKVLDKDAVTFKPTDNDAKRDAMAILDAIKQKEEQQKWKVSTPGETTQVVDETISSNRQQLADDVKDAEK